MIDFQNAKFVKLKARENGYEDILSSVMAQGESVLGIFQGIRDGVVFTTKRVIAINIQGVTGKKKDITSLPYSKIQAYSVETAGTFDMDSELQLWFSGMGVVPFEFTGGTDVAQMCGIISRYILF